MQKTLIATAVATLLTASGNSFAGSTNDRLVTLEKRLAYLEQRVQSQDAVIAEKNEQIARLGGSSNDGGPWFQSFEIGGVVEIEAGRNSEDESDVTVPTVELGVAAHVNDWVAAEVVALYEDEGDHSGEFSIDTATVTLADPDANWFVTAGQYTLPFGVFESNMISDPLTLELGETADVAVEAGFANERLSGSVYVFQGDQRDTEIDNFGATLGFETEANGVGIAANVGYINDIAESDNLVDAVATTNKSAAWTASAVVSLGAFTLIGEYVTTTDALASGEEPSAFNIEAAVNFEAGGLPATFAVGYQGTNEADASAGLAESRVLSALAIDIHEGTSIAIESLAETAYDGNHTATLAAKVTVEF